MAEISVVIPVFNGSPYVAEAVRSALAQPETGEVLLIEDGSTDRSLSVCRDLAAQNGIVKLLRHSGGKNRGPGASRNLGVLHATSDLIAFLDADDFFYPERFKRSFPILKSNSAIDGVYEAIDTVFESPQWESQWRRDGKPLVTTLRFAPPPERLFDLLLIGDCGHLHVNGLLVRRRLLDRCGHFHEGLRRCQDTHLWIKMAALGRLAPGRLSETVGARRVHEGNRFSCPSLTEIVPIRSAMWRSLLAWGRDQYRSAR